MTHYLNRDQYENLREVDGITAYGWMEIRLNREDFLWIMSHNPTEEQLFKTWNTFGCALKSLVPKSERENNGGYWEYLKNNYIKNFGKFW